jgi:hypothetical protein
MPEKLFCRACGDAFESEEPHAHCTECRAELAGDISGAVQACLDDNQERSERREKAYNAQVYRQRMGRMKTDS